MLPLRGALVFLGLFLSSDLVAQVALPASRVLAPVIAGAVAQVPAPVAPPQLEAEEVPRYLQREPLPQLAPSIPIPPQPTCTEEPGPWWTNVVFGAGRRLPVDSVNLSGEFTDPELDTWSKLEVMADFLWVPIEAWPNGTMVRRAGAAAARASLSSVVFRQFSAACTAIGGFPFTPLDRISVRILEDRTFNPSPARPDIVVRGTSAFAWTYACCQRRPVR